MRVGSMSLVALATLSLVSAWAQERQRPARIVVTVQPGAVVTIDGDATRSSGARRIFNSPALPPGRTFHYVFEAKWTEDGQPRSARKRVEVSAGSEVVVDLSKADQPAPSQPPVDRPPAGDAPRPTPPPADRPSTVQTPSADKGITYQLEHVLRVKDVPEGAKELEVWFWIPSESKYQQVLDTAVRSAPMGFQIIERQNNKYMYAKVANPGPTLTIDTTFRLHRDPIKVAFDPGKSVPSSAINPDLHAPDLLRNVPNMEVDDEILKLANAICKDETDVVKQARMLYDYVLGETDYVGKNPAVGSSASVGKPNPLKPRSKWGSAHFCLDHKGGGCIDQHSLFVALARARGIPTRLQFGTLLDPKMEGKEHNPGHRCWVQYWVPTYGWTPLDIAAADGATDKETRDFYFSNLDAHRLMFLEGRNFHLLRGESEGPLVNLMIIAHVLVDGKDHESFERTIKFTVEK